MSILVAGACGLTGRHLVTELVRRGEKVTAVDIDCTGFVSDDDITYVEVDVCSAPDLGHEWKHVYNLASAVDPDNRMRERHLSVGAAYWLRLLGNGRYTGRPDLGEAEVFGPGDTDSSLYRFAHQMILYGEVPKTDLNKFHQFVHVDDVVRTVLDGADLQDKILHVNNDDLPDLIRGVSLGPFEEYVTELRTRLSLPEGYEIKDGVIHHAAHADFPIQYDHDYSAKYDRFGEVGRHMGHVRLGYMIGAIGRVPTSVLDVGYGNGDFLKACKRIVPSCAGTDLSEDYPVPEGCRFEKDLEAQYDVVTFFDSLEHFHDLDVVRKLKCNYVVITLPRCHYESKEWFEQWRHQRPGEHIWHFDARTLRATFEAAGFETLQLDTGFEDCIRKYDSQRQTNILTGVFRKTRN